MGQGACPVSPVALCVSDQDAVHIPNHPTGAAFLEIARNLFPSCFATHQAPSQHTDKGLFRSSSTEILMYMF